MTPRLDGFRLAFLAGTLGKGGAEKQLLYAARALRGAGADVRVYCLNRGEFYEKAFAESGMPPVWLGASTLPVVRLFRFTRELRSFRPAVVQAAHFYVNLYVAIAATLCGASGVGTVRNDVHHELSENPFWGRRLLGRPRHLLVNSFCARDNAVAFGRNPRDVQVLSNVIDLEAFDRAARGAVNPPRPRLIAVGRLVAAKRFDRFLRAVARVRSTVPEVRAAIVGDGPERASLEELARDLGLGPDVVEFLGPRDDVPGLLSGATALVVTSDHEGFPNVVLEAMAAGLPVVTTPAGDAPRVVRDGETGRVVAFDDAVALAGAMVDLLRDPGLARRLGSAGREVAAREFSPEGLVEKLTRFYGSIGARDLPVPELSAAQAAPGRAR